MSEKCSFIFLGQKQGRKMIRMCFACEKTQLPLCEKGKRSSKTSGNKTQTLKSTEIDEITFVFRDSPVIQMLMWKICEQFMYMILLVTDSLG